MLSIYLGQMDQAIYHPPTYFDNQYEDEWIIIRMDRESEYSLFILFFAHITAVANGFRLRISYHMIKDVEFITSLHEFY